MASNGTLEGNVAWGYSRALTYVRADSCLFNEVDIAPSTSAQRLDGLAGQHCWIPLTSGFSEGQSALDGPHGPRAAVRYVDLMAGVPQIAADLNSAASRQPWPIPEVGRRANSADRPVVIVSLDLKEVDHELVNAAISSKS